MSIPTPLTHPTLPTTPVWVGSSDLQESSESPVISSTKDGIIFTKIFEGPYSVCQSNFPSRLSELSGVPSDYTVDTVTLRPGGGSKGIMTITLCVAPSNGVTIGGDGTATEEVEWAEVQRPLKSHAMFQHGGVNELELTDLAAIQIWQNQEDPVKIAALKYVDANGATQDLTTNAKVFATKWLRGQESYNEYAPVCRSTIVSPSSPTSGGCGLIGDPAIGSPPPDYKWLKSADRVLKRGRTWERIQEWIGAWWWDTDIYDSASTGGSDGGGSDE